MSVFFLNSKAVQRLAESDRAKAMQRFAESDKAKAMQSFAESRDLTQQIKAIQHLAKYNNLQNQTKLSKSIAEVVSSPIHVYLLEIAKIFAKPVYQPAKKEEAEKKNEEFKENIKTSIAENISRNKERQKETIMEMIEESGFDALNLKFRGRSIIKGKWTKKYSQSESVFKKRWQELCKERRIYSLHRTNPSAYDREKDGKR